MEKRLQKKKKMLINIVNFYWVGYVPTEFSWILQKLKSFFSNENEIHFLKLKLPGKTLSHPNKFKYVEIYLDEHLVL